MLNYMIFNIDKSIRDFRAALINALCVELLETKFDIVFLWRLYLSGMFLKFLKRIESNKCIRLITRFGTLGGTT